MNDRITRFATILTLAAATVLGGCASDVDDTDTVDIQCLDDCMDVASRTSDDVAYLEALGDFDKTLVHGDIFDIDGPVAEAIIIAHDGEMTDEGRAFIEELIKSSVDQNDWAAAVLAARADDAEELSPLENKVLAKIQKIFKTHYEELPQPTVN
jgi:hypothetical protein